MADTTETTPQELSTQTLAATHNDAGGPGAPVVVAVFDDRFAAEEAVEALQEAGFSSDRIGYVIRGSDAVAGGMLTDSVGAKDGRGAAAGIVAGGMAGGVIAAAVAILLPGVGTVAAVAGGILSAFFGGTVAGMAVGGILGALTGLGISENEARLYEQKFHEGKAIVAVRAGARAGDASQLLARHGGYHVHSEGVSPIPTEGYFHTP
jgi:hypothetical protein